MLSSSPCRASFADPERGSGYEVGLLLGLECDGRVAGQIGGRTAAHHGSDRPHDRHSSGAVPAVSRKQGGPLPRTAAGWAADPASAYWSGVAGSSANAVSVTASPSKIRPVPASPPNANRSPRPARPPAKRAGSAEQQLDELARVLDRRRRRRRALRARRARSPERAAVKRGERLDLADVVEHDEATADRSEHPHLAAVHLDRRATRRAVRGGARTRRASRRCGSRRRGDRRCRRPPARPRPGPRAPPAQPQGSPAPACSSSGAAAGWPSAAPGRTPRRGAHRPTGPPRRS